MPETAIDKNDDAEFWKSKIWFAKKFIIPSPSANTKFLENSDQLDFGGFIAFRFHRSHYL
jgi:hypothetical protein